MRKSLVIVFGPVSDPKGTYGIAVAQLEDDAGGQVLQELKVAPTNATEKRRETMNDQNYTTTFTVDQTPEEVFAAINNVRGWWSEEIEGSTDKLGDEFTYHYQDVHRCKMKLTEVIPGKKVGWLVLDNYFNFIKDKTEWKGTEITFEISKRDNKTEVRFTHLGLVPKYECYDICSDAWGTYINGSLKNLITTGKGEPNQKEKGVPARPKKGEKR